MTTERKPPTQAEIRRACQRILDGETEEQLRARRGLPRKVEPYTVPEVETPDDTRDYVGRLIWR